MRPEARSASKVPGQFSPGVSGVTETRPTADFNCIALVEGGSPPSPGWYSPCSQSSGVLESRAAFTHDGARMTGSYRELKTASEQRPGTVGLWDASDDPPREAREVLRQLARIVSTRRIHRPDNPIYQKFIGELFAKVSGYLTRRGTLVFGIRRFEFLYEGEAIFNDSNQNDSLPFRLYKDGVSALAFHPGVTEEELRGLVETIHRGYEVTSTEDDVVTLLWERCFQHISYDVTDEPSEGQSVPEPPVVETTKTRVASMAPPTARDLSPEEPLARERYVLTEQDVEKLREEMVAEAAWDMGFQLIDLILEVLAVREEMVDYPLALDIMERVIRVFILRGSFGHAARILKALRDLERDSAHLPARHRALLGEAVQRMGEAERIREIGPVLDKSLDSEMAHFETYLRLLPRRAVEPLLDLLGGVNVRKARRALCEALAELLGGDLEPIGKRLDDARWFVVRNLVYILRRTGSRSAIPYLRRTLEHPHPKVRQETLHAMEGIGMARSAEFLLRLLDSTDEICRTWALERLAALGDSRAAEPLWRVIRTREFRERSWNDKRAYFEALGRCAPPGMLPTVQALYEKRGWFEKPKDLEMRAGAAIALGLIGGERVMPMLEEGCQAEEALIRGACRQALDGIRRRQAGPRPEEIPAHA